jgi:hypothetical protein
MKSGEIVMRRKPMRRALWSGGTSGLLLLCVLGLGGCDDLLEVDLTGVVLPSDIEEAGPSAVPTLINGMVGSYHEAADDIARYAALITDEMISAGTFPTRTQVDSRRIQPNNLTLTFELYTPLHQARFMADTVVYLLESRLVDPDFDEVQGELRRGIALGKLYGGYSRIWLAELYCWSILTGMAPESSPLLPDARMQQALGYLQDAEAMAISIGDVRIYFASVLGQARIHLWLQNYGQAAALASMVPRDFVYWAEYSDNSVAQSNELYLLTWGESEEIHWTVGDGNRADRGFEQWPHLNEFVALNLLRNRPPGFTSAAGTIPVVLQTLYRRPEAKIYLASGIEARLILAEAAVRSGQLSQAQDFLNDLRSDYSNRVVVQWGVELPAPANQLQPLTLPGSLDQALTAVAGERARELWLTGDRHTTARRLRLDPSSQIDLVPPIKVGINGGDDIAFPIVQRELDNNPELTSGDACPAGQAIGGWR